MRILLISAAFSPDPGGVATHVTDLAHGLVGLKHTVSVVTLNKDSTARRDGRNRLTIWKRPRRQVYEFDGRRVFCEGILEFLFNEWHQLRPDLVHVHDLDSLFLGCMVKIAFDKPPVMTVHRAPSPWRRGRFREIPKDCAMEAGRLSKMLDGIVVPSQASRAVLCDQGFGTDGTRPEITVIPHGISRFLRGVADEPNVLEKICPAGGCTLILCPSRADEHKDVETFIEAAARLRAAKPEVPLLFVVGSQAEDDQHEKLQKRAHDLGLNILFQSFLYKEMATVYRHAKVCVFPSRHESFGLAVLESFLFDIPVVAANTSALREIITNGENGLLFTDGNPLDLASQILRVLQDGKLRDALRKGGKKALRETSSYHSKTMVRSYEAFYKRILGL